MSSSSATPVDDLIEWRNRLDALVAQDAETMLGSQDQLAIENTIAAGIAVLAGEVLPAPSAEEPTRPMLARDLRITTDLVLRALQAHRASS